MGHWDTHAATFRSELAAAVPTDVLRGLHRLRPGRHAVVVLRVLACLALGVAAILLWPHSPIALLAGAGVIGLVVFAFTVLLHEVVHGLVSGKRTHPMERILAYVYAVPSGLSQSQFTRWHLDHHDELGTGDRDPKRAHLTPKINRRWFKALYFTPVLFPIYFRAARRAAAGYPAQLRQRIAWERRLALGFHIALLGLLSATLGPWRAAWLHAIPVFVVFPLAFATNRLGQHYDINPDDPAAWGTVLRRSPLTWDLIYLWSNYHMEHHLFPRVPCYNLPALRKALDPFFAARGIRPRTYGGLLWDWLVRNKPPHTNWRLGARSDTQVGSR